MAHTIACMAYTVKVSNLEKSYGEHVVLTGVHMQIGHGSVYALLGPNGAGKTTLVRTLATLTPADSGTASIAGHDLASEARSIRAKIGLTGQFAAIDEDRKSTRLNSSHVAISYADFCLKKKNNK